MQTALPYILLVVFYGVMALYQYSRDDEKIRPYINVACLLVFLIFFGMRGFIFYDWMSYFPLYNHISDIGALTQTHFLKWEAEPGFLALILICKWIYPSYHFFVFTCTLINTCLLYNFLNSRIKYVPLGMLIFVCMGGIELSTDLMRNSISILIFTNSLVFIEKRKFLPYLCLCLLGASFHVSSFAYIPIYFILNKSFKKWHIATVLIIANIVYLLHIPVFKSIVSLVAGIIMPSTQLWIDTYMEMDPNTGSAISIGYLERLFTCVILFCYIDKLRELRNNSSIYINSIVLYLFLFLFLSEFKTISMRVSFLFIFGYWIIWYDLFKCFHYSNNRWLFTAFVAIYCILKTYGTCRNPLAEYDNVLFGIKTYTERVVLFRRHFEDTQKK